MTPSRPGRQRMFYNDDGDSCLGNYRGSFAPRMVTDAVDVLAGTPITTLVYCVMPSDLANYPSEIAEMPGWRRTPSHESGPYRRHYEFYQHVRRHNWDIPRMIAERAAERGLEFIPSMRMNDAHFGQKVHPTEHPWTGKFWMENQDLVMGPATFPFWGNQHLLDFRHEKVREFKLALAFEAIDRYGSEGFEMDWTRHYTFFRPGEERPELITEMVRRVRERLDRRGKDRRLPLIMRLAADIETSLRCGLDAATWVREGLVDYLVPSSPSRYISFDMPIREWVELAAGTGVEVHPSPDSAAIVGNGQASLEMYRAAASNYFAMGAHGFYVFNLFCQGYPLEDEQYMVLRDVSHPAALDRRDKLFMASPDAAAWRQDRDVLPAVLPDSDPIARIDLWVGDDLAACREEGYLDRAELQVRVDHLEPDDGLEIKLNGTILNLAAAQVRAPGQRDTIAHNAGHAAWTYEGRELGGNPGIWFKIELRDELPIQGENQVSIRQVSRRNRRVKVVNVNLRATYAFCGTQPLVGRESG